MPTATRGVRPCGLPRLVRIDITSAIGAKAARRALDPQAISVSVAARKTADIGIAINIGPIDAPPRFPHLPRVAPSRPASGLKNGSGGGGILCVFAVITAKNGGDPVSHVDIPPRPAPESLLAAHRLARPRGLPSLGIAALIGQKRLSQPLPMRHTGDGCQALGTNTWRQMAARREDRQPPQRDDPRVTVIGALRQIARDARPRRRPSSKQAA